MYYRFVKVLIITLLFLSASDTYSQNYTWVLIDFENKLSDIKLNYISELERDNGRRIINSLQVIKSNTEDYIKAYRKDFVDRKFEEYKNYDSEYKYKMVELEMSMDHVLKKLNYYKQLSASLNFIIGTSTGESPHEISYEDWGIGIVYLGLNFYTIKKTECGTVFFIEFGNPKYVVYFFHNESKETGDVNYEFRGDKKISGNQWMEVVIHGGGFGVGSNNVDGLGRFRDVPSYRNVKLSNCSCSKFN